MSRETWDVFEFVACFFFFVLFFLFSEKKLDLPLIKGVDTQTEKTTLVMDWILQMGMKADS